MHYPPNEPITFSRDCDAVIIPSGDEVRLSEGVSGFLTQALGGSFSVYIEGNLFRIAGVDADAIGKEPIEPPNVPVNPTTKEIEKVVWEQLKTCYDPEIPINVVDLGLIYSCEIQTVESNEYMAKVEMTLTAPGCGMGPMIAQQAEWRIAEIDGVEDVSVEIVHDPPWNPDMITEDGKIALGMD